jgi:hypothetical protein
MQAKCTFEMSVGFPVATRYIVQEAKTLYKLICALGVDADTLLMSFAHSLAYIIKTRREFRVRKKCANSVYERWLKLT